MNFIYSIIALIFLAHCTSVKHGDYASVRNPTPTTVAVAIVGAGLSGLSSAYYLKKSNIPFHVLESSMRVGGRVKTMTYEHRGEILFADSGMEEYWESNPAIDVIHELKLPIAEHIALSSIKIQNKIYPYTSQNPNQFFNSIFTEDENKKFQNLKAKIKNILEGISQQNKSTVQLTAISFADWIKSEKTSTKISEWIRVSLECEIGTSWDKISALDGIAEFHIFLGKNNYGEKSFRIVQGNEIFTHKLKEVLGEENFSFGKVVNRITSLSDHVEISFFDTRTHQVSNIKAKDVILTIPLFRLSEIQFSPPLSPYKKNAINSMSWGSYFKAHVFVPSNTKNYWTQNNESILPILTDSELGVIYDGNLDQENQTRILSLLITGHYAETFNMMPLDQVSSIIKKKFGEFWPGIESKIERMEFYRYHPRAIASWPVGRSRFDELSNAIRKSENHIFLAGDFTESSHSDGAFISAKRVTQEIINQYQLRH